jgi:hypothetical protein
MDASTLLAVEAVRSVFLRRDHLDAKLRGSAAGALPVLLQPTSVAEQNEAVDLPAAPALKSDDALLIIGIAGAPRPEPPQATEAEHVEPVQIETDPDAVASGADPWGAAPTNTIETLWDQEVFRWAETDDDPVSGTAPQEGRTLMTSTISGAAADDRAFAIVTVEDADPVAVSILESVCSGTLRYDDMHSTRQTILEAARSGRLGTKAATAADSAETSGPAIQGLLHPSQCTAIAQGVLQDNPAGRKALIGALANGTFRNTSPQTRSILATSLGVAESSDDPALKAETSDGASQVRVVPAGSQSQSPDLGIAAWRPLSVVVGLLVFLVLMWSVVFFAKPIALAPTSFRNDPDPRLETMSPAG